MGKGQYTNAELLARVDGAFKAITVGDLDEGILTPDKFDQFVRVIQRRTRILDEARFIPMDSQQVEIDRVGFVGRVLRAGLESDKTSHKTLEEGDHVKPEFWNNKLIAQELQAITGIKDQALRRNIERGNFEDTLLDLFGEAAGRDLEEFNVRADTDTAYGTDAVLSLTDGWAKLAENHIYGQNGDFDPSDSDAYPENMFEALLSAIPKKYLQNRSEWRFYVDWDVENAYRNLLRERQTSLGDAATLQHQDLTYKGIPVRYVPMLERDNASQGDIAMLQHPDNMVWGLFHEVTIERDRIPKERRTDFVLTLEGDAHYEDENAAVVAHIDKSSPES